MSVISYMVVSVRNTDIVSLVRPIARQPTVCDGEQVAQGCLQAIEKHIKEVRPNLKEEAVISKKQLDMFYHANLKGLTAFAENESMKTLMISARISDPDSIVHNVTLFLQKIEAVNPYKG